jgi:hypothetical protein
LLKSGSGFDKGDISLIYIGLFAGIVIAAILSAVLYDKVGPGVLGIIGAVIIMGVNIQWMYVDGHASAFLFVSSFVALIAGVGFTVAAGLMGAALGGPLPSLVPRMVTVQFIRVTVSAVIPVISSTVFAKVYKDHLATVSAESQMASKENFTQSLHVKSEIITYHTFSTFSCVLSIIVLILSFLMFLTGKGHKLAHKPHDKETHKEKLSTEEVHIKKTTPVFERSPKEAVSNQVIGDSEYRKALKKFGQPKPSPDKTLHMRDQEYRKALKRMKDIGQ